MGARIVFGEEQSQHIGLHCVNVGSWAGGAPSGAQGKGLQRQGSSFYSKVVVSNGARVLGD